jgi:hypothetical protein
VREKKRKERSEKEREEESCKQSAQNYGYCCHQHAKVAKTEEEERRRQMKKQKDEVNKLVDIPDHCIHCDDNPCVFIQIKLRLFENDEIYYDKNDYRKDPVACNSGRCKRTYQQAAFVLWKGINFWKSHYRCERDGVRVLFSPLDGKIMGYKTSENSTL